MKILILGAGLTGIGAAYHLKELGFSDFRLYDRNTYVGGLSASFRDDKGFTWDVGGHVLFSHYDYFDRVVNEALSGEYYKHFRESWIRVLQTWVPYPFQNNIRYLPDDAILECLEGLRNLDRQPKNATNFHEWMKTVFGSGIVKYFMEPYNVKTWGVPLDIMSINWIDERVSVVDISRVESNIAEKRDDISWGSNNQFLFPKQGGTGAICEGIARPLKDNIYLQHEVVKINLMDKKVSFANGCHDRYDFLINTTPLDTFVQRCEDAPESVKEASGDLVHNSALIVGVGFAGRRADSKCWMYFPENDTPFYRATNFHNYSPFNVPNGDTGSYFSLMCETTYSSYKPVDKTKVVDETVLGLINSGLVGKSDTADIFSKYLIDVPYSYPVPTLHRDKALSVIQPYLESRDIYSRGRFGAWKYEVGNMDHSFMQGVEAVERILNGRKELTVNNLI
ncbi:MAG TPA: FAD-dependent oxidoreductase [Thermodesulfovibrionales bacterium]|nr:FAD-dependent oxidoreductase [Thermodesulfovibrionales bacterium]